MIRLACVSALALFSGVLGLPEVQPPLAAVNGEGTFLQLFEWSWADVATECEQWLGPKGFSAVQVSPANEHVVNDAWWARYQPVTYQLVSRSGDEAAFIDMVHRCNKVGVGIYADAVINHIAAGSGQGVAGSHFQNRETPIYGQSDMHHDNGNLGSNCAVKNYADKHNVQYCDLVGLPDLCTSCDSVQKKVSSYIGHMADIGIAGIRVDAAKHMDADELGQLLSRVSQPLYRFGEVIEGSGEGVTPDMYFSFLNVTEFGYLRDLQSNFIQEGKLQYLQSFGESWHLLPSKKAVVFLDNHDTQRGESQLTYKNGKLYQLATIFMLAHPYGYPKVMSSYYFDSHDQGPPKSPVHDAGAVNCGSVPALSSSASAAAPWVCEHRWAPIANMVAWRRSAGTRGLEAWQAPGGDTIAFCRGGQACLALNRQEHATWSATLKFTVPAGRYCDVIRSDDTSSCPTISVAEDGSVQVDVPPLGAVAVHLGKKVATVDEVLV